MDKITKLVEAEIKSELDEAGFLKRWSDRKLAAKAAAKKKSLKPEKDPGLDMYKTQDQVNPGMKYPFASEWLSSGKPEVLRIRKEDAMALALDILKAAEVDLPTFSSAAASLGKDPATAAGGEGEGAAPGAAPAAEKLGTKADAEALATGGGDAAAAKALEATPSVFPAERPISIMRQQKGGVGGEGTPKETPVVKHLQQLGLAVRDAQVVSKGVGAYLKKRGMAISEASVAESIDKFLSLKEAPIKGRKIKATPKNKSIEAGIRRQLQKWAEAEDWKNVRKFLQKVKGLMSKGTREEFAKHITPRFAELSDEEVESSKEYLFNWATGALNTWGKGQKGISGEFYLAGGAGGSMGAQTGGSFSAEQASKSNVINTTIRNLHKVEKSGKLDALSKVLIRHLSKNLTKQSLDAYMGKGKNKKGEVIPHSGKKTLLDLMKVDNPEKPTDAPEIRKLSKSIKNVIQRQLKRRGRDPSEINKLMESVSIIIENILAEGSAKKTKHFREGDKVRHKEEDRGVGVVVSRYGNDVGVRWKSGQQTHDHHSLKKVEK